MRQTISIDFETFYKKKEYSVADMGNWRYCHDDRFDPFIIAAYDGSESWVGETKDFNWDALEGQHVIAHNASFEESACDRLAELGVAPSWLTRGAGCVEFDCTADLTAFICSERSLASAYKALRNQNLSKEARDMMNGVTWAQAKQKGWGKQLLEYCRNDTIECRKLWTDYSPQWSEFERQISRLTRRQSARGIAINWELLYKYRQWLQEAIFILVQSLPWTKDGAKPTSSIAIAEECRRLGIPAPPVKSHDEEAFEAWRDAYGPRFPWIYNVSDWRSLNKTLGVIDTMIERRRPDDTIDFSLLYFGAHTGRFSGGGSGLNMQNWKKDAYLLIFLPNKQGIRFFKSLDAAKGQFSEAEIAANGKLIDLRSLLVPRAGKKFIIADLSQIEPRVLAYLTQDFAYLSAMASGQSPYEAHARATMGWTGGSLKKEDPEKYKLAKARVLGLGYQCGAEKFISVAYSMAGLRIDPETSSKCVLDFRMSNPRILAMWETLDNAFRRSVGGDYLMELPSGRTMTYRNVRREVRHKRNKETGEMEKRFVFRAQTGLDWVELYGGKLTENLVQAVSRDVFCFHMLALEKEVGDVIFHVHDEAITEVDKDVPKAEVERIMATRPDWLPDCPLSAEAIDAAHYLK